MSLEVAVDKELKWRHCKYTNFKNKCRCLTIDRCDVKIMINPIFHIILILITENAIKASANKNANLIFFHLGRLWGDRPQKKIRPPKFIRNT